MITRKNVNEIEGKGLFDFVVNNYWKISKEDMKDLFKEFVYAVYDIDGSISKKAIKQMISTLEEDGTIDEEEV